MPEIRNWRWTAHNEQQESVDRYLHSNPERQAGGTQIPHGLPETISHSAFKAFFESIFADDIYFRFLKKHHSAI